MRSSTLLALAALGLSSAALPAFAGTLFVPQQFPTVQKALNAAKPGDTVLVSAKPKGAVYNEAVTINTPNIVLQGVGGPILDGTGLGTIVNDPYFGPYTVYPNGIDIRASHVAVRGMTIQNVGDPNAPGASAINVGYFSADGSSLLSFGGIEISSDTLRNNSTGLTLAGATSDPAVNNGAFVLLKGDSLTGCTITNSAQIAAQITGTSGMLVAGNKFSANATAGLSFGSPASSKALITGNQFLGNNQDGLDAAGEGLTIAGNEAASNIGIGLSVTATTYNPAAGTAKSPNPAASTVTGNSSHDNQNGGVSVTGTVAILGNSLSRNGGSGLLLNSADYSTVAANSITGTVSVGQGDGFGIYATESSFGVPGGFLSITGNAVTGNVGDGIYFGSVVGSAVFGNDASSNGGVGIHLSNYATNAAFFGTPGVVANTITFNQALRNKVVDARDDAVAVSGDNGKFGPTVNVWTKNLFGTTDPVGLSK